jgi:hypothetical protein
MAKARGKGTTGPKARLRNPSPIVHEFENGPGKVEVVNTDWIYASDLDADERALRSFFKRRRVQLVRRGDEDVPRAIGRIAKLAEEALIYCDAGRTWSDRFRVERVDESRQLAVWPFSRRYQRRVVGPHPPQRPSKGALWIDTSSPQKPLEYWDLASEAWKVFYRNTADSSKSPAELFNDLQTSVGCWSEWIDLTLGRPIRRMLTGQMGRLTRGGKPAFLSAAILADLLGEKPEKVADFLAYYRR